MKDTSFANCFIDLNDLYHYDIVWEGKVVAKAHTLSAKDKSKVETLTMKKKFVKGDLEMDIDSHYLKTITIMLALDWWDSPRKINEDEISMLPEGMRDFFYKAIQDHESEVQKVVEDTEKN